MRTVVLILPLALAACSTQPIQPPKVVEVVVEKLVPVPAPLTEPCRRPQKQNNTVAEAVRLANERDAALVECSSRMTKIRSLSP
jgi:hypothetical protein